MFSFDIYSPLCLIFGGVLGLVYFRLISRFSAVRRRVALHEQLAAIQKRFEMRSRLSWVMIVFGTLWLLQLVVEQAWAG